ncbi:conserved hypothetical protein [Treponema primitia ZAS-2]|uniref:DUF2804 domain-containing protein n=1 Tax=Treponema primitia (strain ATCC BAA-887 / DSM 12427 / ZAS-2) TaxID=545694 RepID=F5YHD6_TREPZ|nr:DUF2804 domain-containing protein [Treponema primitia]AEF86255.1 conserved hypothetical protein [Treponema primitia ZAS-2]
MAPIETDTQRPILDETGKPVNFGWARSPLFLYNKDLVHPPYGRITESERYIIFSPTHLMIFDVMDGGCLGYISISVVSLKDKKRSTQPFTIPFPLGIFDLPSSSETGSARIQRKKFAIDFSAMEGGSRIIKVDIPRFGHHRRLRGEVVLSPPPGAESMVTCSPWRREKNAFWYTRRSPWYIAEGVMQFGSTELVFLKDKAWGIFDWNRGVRPRGDIRLWAAACGKSGGRQIGFNVGYSSADSGPGTENAFFAEGKLHKLDQVTFHIPPTDWLEPWRFTSNDKRLEMTFTPHQERSDRNVMFFHTLTRRQVCGSFSGKVILDDGAKLEFQDITGFAERRKTRF